MFDAVRHRIQFCERVWQNLRLGIDSPEMDFRKPLMIYWFMSHVIKCVFIPTSLNGRVLTRDFRGLVLWEADPTLLIALETAKTFASRTEYLMMFWPSDGASRCR